LVGNPLFDCIPEKTVVSADLEHWNLMLVNQFVERPAMNL